jgi:Tfp pilus assembly protein PilW
MRTNGTMTAPQLDTEAGFSLAELLVAFALIALVLAGATTAFHAGSRVLEFGVDQAAAQQTARAALQQVAREIRWAGYGFANFPAITNQNPTSITLQNDFDGVGGPVAAVGCNPTAVNMEVVRYRLDGTNLMRSDNGTNACDVVVAGGITGLTFQYLDVSGAATAVPADIRTVVITMNAASQNGAAERTIVMRDEVRLRNR